MTNFQHNYQWSGRSTKVYLIQLSNQHLSSDTQQSTMHGTFIAMQRQTVTSTNYCCLSNIPTLRTLNAWTDLISWRNSQYTLWSTKTWQYRFYNNWNTFKCHLKTQLYFINTLPKMPTSQLQRLQFSSTAYTAGFANVYLILVVIIKIIKIKKKLIIIIFVYQCNINKSNTMDLPTIKLMQHYKWTFLSKKQTCGNVIIEKKWHFY